MRAARRQRGWGWVGFGLAGSLMLTAANSQLNGGRPVHWWLVVHLGSPAFAHWVLWVGLAALCAAWLGLGLRGGAVQRDPRMLLLAGAVWALPPLLGPALFSNDMYSYFAQGDLLRLGVDPYHHGPAALAGLHQSRVLATVSPFWRQTPAPYGPLFVGLAAAVTAIAGSHLVLGILLLRALELPGLVLLAVFVPRLARALGADPARATWLAVISPLVVIELVAGGHNDALMAGLLVAGVTYAVERRPLVAIALCTLAATIKLPAAAAAAMILACWLRAELDQRRDSITSARAALRTAARVLGSGVLVSSAVLVAVGLLATVGFSWVGGGLLSTPAKVHLAITPATAFGWTLHSLFGSGSSAQAHPLESIFATVTLALTAVLGIVLMLRVGYGRLVPYLGVLLLASAFGGPAAWPWYLCWAIALLAVCPRPQRWPALPAMIVAGVFVIGPGGTLALPIDDSPQVLAVYAGALLSLAVGYGRSRRVAVRVRRDAGVRLRRRPQPVEVVQ